MVSQASETGQERALYRRGQFLTALTRWLSLGLGLLALGILWAAPGVQPLPALAVGLGYAVFAVAVHLWQRRFGRSRALKVAHDVADALAVGAGAALSGGTQSPLWLFLYPRRASHGLLLACRRRGAVDLVCHLHPPVAHRRVVNRLRRVLPPALFVLANAEYAAARRYCVTCCARRSRRSASIGVQTAWYASS